MKLLCAKLGEDFDEIRGDGPSEKALELVRYFARRKRIPDLLEQVRQERPGVEFPDIPDEPGVPDKKHKQLAFALLFGVIALGLLYLTTFRGNRFSDDIVVTETAVTPTDPPAPTVTIAVTPNPTPTGVQPIEFASLTNLKPIYTLEAHQGPVLDVAFSPDGRWLISSGADGMLRVWELSSATLSSEIEVSSNGWLQAITVSPNGELIATGGNDALVNIWTLPDLELDARFRGHSGIVFAVAFSPSGQHLVSGDGAGVIKLWNVSTGIEEASYQLSDVAIYDLAFDSTETHIFAANLRQGLAKLSIDSNKISRQFCPKFSESVSAIAVLPVANLITNNASLSTIAAGTDAGSIFIVDSDCTVLNSFPNQNAYINGLDYSYSEELIVSGSADGTVAIGPPFVLLRIHEQSVETVAFSPDNTLVASGDANGKIILWGIKE
jgi:WD40 repeat protein